jgi:hypothetical protein
MSSTCIVNQQIVPYWRIYVKPSKKNIWTRRRFSRMSLWKTWSNVWDIMVVEQGLIRTSSWWTMHQRRASGSLGIEVPDVTEKGKWMFNPRNQASHEESHISKCQSLLNQDIKWLRDQKWKVIIRCEALWATISKKSMSKQDQMWQPSWSQKKWSGKNQHCANSSWRNVFYI